MRKPSEWAIAISAMPAIGLAIELLHYSLGSQKAFSDLPRGFAENRFMDLKIWTTNGADCWIPIEAIRADTHCAISNYVFDYPRAPLYIIRLLGIGSHHNIVLGTVLGIATILLAWMLIYQTFSELQSKEKIRSITCLLTTAAIFTSYQVRLLVERGQLDMFLLLIVVLPFVIGSARQLESINTEWLLPIYLISAFIKPLMLAPALFICIDIVHTSVHFKSFNPRGQLINRVATNRTFSATKAVFSCAAFGTTCALLKSDISVASHYLASTVTGGKIGFGLTTLLDAPYRDWSLSISGKLALITISALIASDKILLKPASQTPLSLKLLPWTRQLFLVSAAIIVPTYAFTDSYSYKMVFFVGVLPALFQDLIGLEKVTKAGARFTLSLCAISFLYGAIRYSDALYAYSEWFMHFLVHPLLIGTIAGKSISYLLRPADLRSSIGHHRR